MFDTYIVSSDRIVCIHKSAAQLHTIAANYNRRVAEFNTTRGTQLTLTTLNRWNKKHDRMLNNAMRLLGLVTEADRSER